MLKLNKQNKLVIEFPKNLSYTAVSFLPLIPLTKDITDEAFNFGKKEGYADSGKYLSKELRLLKKKENIEIDCLQSKIDDVMDEIREKYKILENRNVTLANAASGTLLLNHLNRIKFLKYDKPYDVLEDFRKMGRLQGFKEARILAKKVVKKEEAKFTKIKSDKSDILTRIDLILERINAEFNKA